MVDSFDECRVIEKRGFDEIKFTLGNPIWIDDRSLQKTKGDFIITFKDKVIVYELKVDTTHHQNIFLETSSNKGKTSGWMIKMMNGELTPDYFAYYFLKPRGELYIIKTKNLVEWAKKNLHHYPEKKQQRIQQMNESYGRPVRIDILKHQAGLYHLPLMEEE